MKKQLVVEYKDGGKVKITNLKCKDNSMFINYLRGIAVSSIKKAVLYTYPIKDNEPLILVENGVSINANVYSCVSERR